MAGMGADVGDVCLYYCTGACSEQTQSWSVAVRAVWEAHGASDVPQSSGLMKWYDSTEHHADTQWAWRYLGGWDKQTAVGVEQNSAYGVICHEKLCFLSSPRLLIIDTFPKI